MTAKKPDKQHPDSAASVRETRLAAQLRANLQRRKAQARARRDGDADQRPDGIEASKSPQKPAED